MARAKSITLKGAAARAFFLTQAREPPHNEEEALLALATRIHVEVHADRLASAVGILKLFKEHGAMKVAGALAQVG